MKTEFVCPLMHFRPLPWVGVKGLLRASLEWGGGSEVRIFNLHAFTIAVQLSLTPREAGIVAGEKQTKFQSVLNIYNKPFIIF